MSNFLSDVWKTVKGVAEHPINEAQWWEDVLTGDVSLKDAPGTHQDMMHETITEPLLGDSWLAKNSDAAAAAIVGGIFAAPVIGGMMGGSAGGAAGAAGGTSGSTGALSSSFSLGDIGSYFNPSNWFGGGNVSDEALGALADAENAAGGAVNADLGLGSDALKSLGYGNDTSKALSSIGDLLKSIKTPEQYKVQHSGGVSGRGFNFNSEQYKNKLMEREMAAIYNQPIYRSPTSSSK